MSPSHQDQQERWELRKQLLQRGIALDPAAKSVRKPWPVTVRLDPNPPMRVLYPWNDLATACRIWVEFVATTRAVYIDEVCLWLPFGDMPFELWPDPRETNHKMYYEFPGFSCPRKDVVNHQLKRKLRPGQPLAGYLLGISQQRLPSNLVSPINASLAIFDAADQLLSRKAVPLAVLDSRNDTPETTERARAVYPLEDVGHRPARPGGRDSGPRWRQ